MPRQRKKKKKMWWLITDLHWLRLDGSCAIIWMHFDDWIQLHAIKEIRLLRWWLHLHELWNREIWYIYVYLPSIFENHWRKWTIFYTNDLNEMRRIWFAILGILCIEHPKLMEKIQWVCVWCNISFSTVDKEGSHPLEWVVANFTTTTVVDWAILISNWSSWKRIHSIRQKWSKLADIPGTAFLNFRYSLSAP